jgi:hypothetical protein
MRPPEDTSPNYIVSPSKPYRGGYAELDRRLSPRWPTTAQQRHRYRQRQRYFGSFCIGALGFAIATALAPIPYVRYVGYAVGGGVVFIAAAFAAIDFISREQGDLK